MNEARAGQGRAGLFGAGAKVERELAEAQARSGLGRVNTNVAHRR